MLNIFFPKLCGACENELLANEEVVCVKCRHNLSLARFHLIGSQSMKNKFYGRVPLENATALLYFRKGSLTQKLIHQLKYRKNKEIGVFLGKWLGDELALTESYKNIDAVISVPLHKKKLRQRGFNQVEGFAKEIAQSLNANYIDDVLQKISPTKSQVFSERITRLFSREEVFSVQNIEKIKGKHILLIDDILTTGATLESCAHQLLQAENIKLSFAVMALTE